MKIYYIALYVLYNRVIEIIVVILLSVKSTKKFTRSKKQRILRTLFSIDTLQDIIQFSNSETNVTLVLKLLSEDARQPMRSTFLPSLFLGSQFVLTSTFSHHSARIRDVLHINRASSKLFRRKSFYLEVLPDCNASDAGRGATAALFDVGLIFTT